jgi:hypothetical protein
MVQGPYMTFKWLRYGASERDISDHFSLQHCRAEGKNITF